MTDLLAGRLAVVTGAAEGIGAAIARGLVAAGADLAAVDVKPIDPAVWAEAGPSGRRVRSYVCDATDPAQVRATCAQLQADLGPASILVNNVGGSGNEEAFDIEDIGDEAWDFVLSLSLSSAMRFSRGLVGGMKAQGFGRIINISSSLKDGVFGPVGTLRGRLAYVTAKMGLIGLTKQLAKDLGPHGITVNALSPGLTLPGPDAKITKRFAALPPEQQQALTRNIPMGRLATGEDMANTACFLASPFSGYVNGETITVAGGA